MNKFMRTRQRDCYAKISDAFNQLRAMEDAPNLGAMRCF